MTDKIKTLYRKHRELIKYVFFGGLTTLVNYVTYHAATAAFGVGIQSATVAAWVLAVLFAYAANRTWVFESKARGGKAFREFCSFVGSRILSLLLDMGVMQLFAVILGYNDKAVKIASNVLVIAANYILGKFIVFRRK